MIEESQTIIIQFNIVSADKDSIALHLAAHFCHEFRREYYGSEANAILYDLFDLLVLASYVGEVVRFSTREVGEILVALHTYIHPAAQHTICSCSGVIQTRISSRNQSQLFYIQL